MSLRLIFVVSLLVLACSTGIANSASWWSLGVSDCSIPGGSCATCALLRHDGIINTEQELSCQVDPGAIAAIAQGTRRAIIECQNQFGLRKWNCTTFLGNDLFGSFVNQHRVRETAIIFSLITSGTVQTVADACHNQKIPGCPCVVPGRSVVDEDGNAILSTCNDNIDWALTTVIEFLTEAYSDNTAIGPKVDIHNIQVGAETVKETSTFCICHGISGTCTVQTCYQKVHELNEVGQGLVGKYDGAVRVQLNADGELERADNLNADPLGPSNLTYVDSSPDFCTANSMMGILGTSNRTCNPAPDATDSCATLCCGRGFYAKTTTTPVRECEFVFKDKFDIVCRITRNITMTSNICV